MYRHGDVLALRIDKIPAKAKRVTPGPRGYVIAEGEATGHAHTIEATSDVEMYERGGVLYMRVLAPTLLLHEQHCRTQTGALPIIAPGVYALPGQLVWDVGTARRVLD